MHRQMRKGEERGGGTHPRADPIPPLLTKTFVFYKHTDKSQQNRECQEREAGI